MTGGAATRLEVNDNAKRHHSCVEKHEHGCKPSGALLDLGYNFFHEHSNSTQHILHLELEYQKGILYLYSVRLF